MVTLHDIYSKLTADINDISFSVIAKGEYMYMADQVALHLSRYIDLFVREIAYTATDEEYSFVVPIQLSPFDNIANGNNITAVASSPHYKVNRLLKVIRRNQDCREISWQAVESASRGNSGFKVNDTTLGWRMYATRLTPDGNLQLHWVEPIIKDEIVTIFALCDLLPEPAYATTNSTSVLSTPKWSDFKNYTPIPDLVVNAFSSQMLVEVLTTMVNRKGEEFANKLMIAKERAKRELYELRRYVASLKSKDSVGQIQPLKWLSEDTGYVSSGNPNIPAEWSSIIIL